MARPIERRQFLAGALSVGAVGLVKSPLPLARTRTRTVPHATTAAAARPAAATRPTTRTLVLLTLYGGNDGLNTVVPYEDPATTPTGATSPSRPNKLLTIGNGYGLNPALPGFKTAVGRRPAGDRPGRRLPRAQPQPLPVDGHLAERLDLGRRGLRLARALARPHGAQTRCRPARSDRRCCPAMAGNRRKAAALQDSTYPGSQLPDADAHFLSVYRELQLPSAGPAPREAGRGLRGVDARGLEDRVAGDDQGATHPCTRSTSATSAPSSASSPSSSGRTCRRRSSRVSQGGYDTHAGEVEIQTANSPPARRRPQRLLLLDRRLGTRCRDRRRHLHRVRPTRRLQRERWLGPRHREQRLRARAPR